MWARFSIDGWPKEEWEPLVGPQGHGVFDQETVARNYPEVTIQFESVSFFACQIQGPLKRVLTKKRRQQVEAEQKENDLRDILIRLPVEEGNFEYSLGNLDLNEVLGFFVRCNLHKYIPTDEAGTRSKAQIILDYVRHYKTEGKDSLWQQETLLKERIENLISQQAEMSA